MRRLTQFWSGLLGCLVFAAGCTGGEPMREPRELAVNEAVVETSSFQADAAEAVAEKSAPKASKTKQPPKSLLSADEIADGWVQLFDGETLFGWQPNSSDFEHIACLP